MRLVWKNEVLQEHVMYIICLYTIFFSGIPESSNDERLKSFALLPALIKSPLHTCRDSWIPRQGVPLGTKASTTDSLSIKGKKKHDTDFVQFQICVWSPTKNGIGHDDNIRHLQSLQWKAPQLTAVSCCNYSKGAGRQELVDFILSGYEGWRVTHQKHIQTPFKKKKKHPIIKFHPMAHIASGTQLFNRNYQKLRWHPPAIVAKDWVASWWVWRVKAVAA